jgi:hypothetical protein
MKRHTLRKKYSVKYYFTRIVRSFETDHCGFLNI